MTTTETLNGQSTASPCGTDTWEGNGHGEAFVPLVQGGHLHTLVAYFLGRWQPQLRSFLRVVRLPDGDALALHDQCPVGWMPGDPVAVLVHGLGGSYQSAYMVRIARKLAARGIRAFRLDLRGAGAGALLARGGYCSCSVQDLHHALSAVARWTCASPVHLVGFSLGANLSLKYGARRALGQEAVETLRSVVAVCPPVDTPRSSRCLQRGLGRLYDRHFVRSLYRRLVWRKKRRPDVQMGQLDGMPRTLREFDDKWTVPLWGFRDAEDYYRAASARKELTLAQVPTLVLTADDDPLVPVESFQGLELPRWVQLQITRGGGHLGFVAARSNDPDRWWLDWRILEWIISHHAQEESQSAKKNAQRRRE